MKLRSEANPADGHDGEARVAEQGERATIAVLIPLKRAGIESGEVGGGAVGEEVRNEASGELILGLGDFLGGLLVTFLNFWGFFIKFPLKPLPEFISSVP